MGNRTEVSTVTVGGAVATVLLWLLAPWLEAHGRPITPEVAAGLTVLVTAIVAYLLPADLLARWSQRTGGAP